MSNSDSKVLGVVLLVRHGDRHGFYQSPESYTPSATAITPLGNQQEYQLGQKLRSLYLNSTSPSFIPGINSTLAELTQLRVRADAGGEGGVVLNSAMSLVQGLFPATTAWNTTLANGTTIVGPLGGYQYIPIESVEPDNDISMEGWTQCGTFNKATDTFYGSPEFKKMAEEHAPYLSQLPQYLDGRPVTLENMWNVFDFMNVQAMHNEAFLRALPPTFLEQGRHLTNWHEYGVFTSPDLKGIGNIAGQTILPSILNSFSSIADPSDPLKFVYHATAYKPFLSLFNMTGAAQMNPELAGFVNFAGALALELRESPSGPVVRFNFKNGTDDVDFKTYNFLGQVGDVPLSTFIDHLAPAAINTTAEWCNVCENAKDRGCAELVLAATGARNHQPISPVGAGFLGAGITLALAATVLALLFLFGMLSLGKTRGKKTYQSSDSVEEKA